MFFSFKRKPTEWVYLELSERETALTEVKESHEKNKLKCCGCCGRDLTIRKKMNVNTGEIQLVSYCPKCKREESGIGIDMYYHKLYSFVKDMF